MTCVFRAPLRSHQGDAPRGCGSRRARRRARRRAQTSASVGAAERAHRDEACLIQYPQVSGCSGLADPGALDDLTHRLVAALQRLDDRRRVSSAGASTALISTTVYMYFSAFDASSIFVVVTAPVASGHSSKGWQRPAAQMAPAPANTRSAGNCRALWIEHGHPATHCSQMTCGHTGVYLPDGLSHA
jgi:hypothetical protein